MIERAVRRLIDAAQRVVRVVVLGFEPQQHLLLVGDAIVVGVAQQKHAGRADEIHAAVLAHEQVHRVAEALGKRAPAVEPAVAVGIGEHANAVAARALRIPSGG